MKIFQLLTLASSLTLSGCFSTPSNGESKQDKVLVNLWEYAYDLDGGAPSVQPLIYKNLIVTSGDKKVTAIDYETGELVWKTPFEHHKQLLNQSFGLKGDVLVGSISKALIAWDIRTGVSKWILVIPDSLSFNNTRGIGTVPDGFIAVSDDSTLFKISPTGSLQTFQIDARSYEAVFANDHLVIGQVKEMKGIISAYHIDSMELLWRFQPGSFGYPAYAPPIIENGIVYVGTTGGPTDSQNGFFALNAVTGQEIWRKEGIFTYAAILVDDRIFGVNGNNVWALNKNTGQMLWSTNSLGGGHSNNNLVYLDGHVYWAHGSGIHVFNEVSGELVHVEPAPDRTTFQLITADKGRIFAQTSRHLYAFAPWGHEEALE